jgi:cytochrome c-type biogenesis protein CcmE
MKPAAWFGLLVIVCALAFGAKAFVTNLTPYVSFADARRAQGTVQVMGSLDKASIRSDAQALDFTLVAKDGSGDRIPVTFQKARPANFAMAIEVTAIGKWDGQVFRADNLLVKCPSKYQGTETTKEYSADAKPGAAPAR